MILVASKEDGQECPIARFSLAPIKLRLSMLSTTANKRIRSDKEA